jgi:sigma-B regulation protein RsbU (phosphoserine phosphatase)
MFVTLFWGFLNTRTGRIDFANAGHMPLMVYRSSRRAVDVFRATGKPIGAFPDEVFRRGLEEQQVTLEPGDCILQFTDGLNEMHDAAGEEYGIERIEDALAAEAGGGARHLVGELRRRLDTFRGAEPQSDDLTIVAVSAIPAAVESTSRESNEQQGRVLSR